MWLTSEYPLNNGRHRLYREHKYIIAQFTRIMQLVATADFSDSMKLSELESKFNHLTSLLAAHAEYEETRIHSLLKIKGSNLFQDAEYQHDEQEDYIQSLSTKIKALQTANDYKELQQFSYELYLYVRNFFCLNLMHFDYEERILLPELQRLASDEELKEIDRSSYRLMSPEQLFEMLDQLFPHMNNEDRIAFLEEIKECVPEKFKVAWKLIAPKLEASERALF